MGHLLALKVTAANEQDREQVGELAQAVQQVPGQQAELAYVDAGYTGKRAAAAAKEHGIKLEVVKLEEAKKGFVPLPNRWVVEGSIGWAARFPDARPFSATRNPGAGQAFTVQAAVVQLHLRVALGLQTLIVKSRLLTGENTVRIRGNPPAFARSAARARLPRRSSA